MPRRMYSEVNHPESNRLRSTCEGDLQQLGVYRRFVTREEESIPFGRASRSSRRDYLRLMLFALTSVNVDGLIYGRWSALSAARVAESLSSRRCLHQVDDYCANSALRGWSESRPRVPFLWEVEAKDRLTAKFDPSDDQTTIFNSSNFPGS